jgi:hypothetical protein
VAQYQNIAEIKIKLSFKQTRGVRGSRKVTKTGNGRLRFAKTVFGRVKLKEVLN